MNPSERIRAALERSHSSEIAEHGHAEVESTLPLLAMSDEDRVELPEPEIDSENDNLAAGPSAAVPRKSAFPVLYIFLAAAVACAGVTAFLNRDRLFPAKRAVAIGLVHPSKLQVGSIPATSMPPASSAPPRQAQVEAPQKATPELTAPRATVRAFTPPPMPTPKKIDDGPPVVLDASTALPDAAVIKPLVIVPEMNAPPPPDPKPSQPPRQVRIGGHVQAANLIKRVAPVYPSLAKTAHVEGTVQFTAAIGKDGRVKNVQYVSGPQILVQAGKEAVRQWVYKPMLLDGQPTEVVTEIDVVFTLK
ncbi:MAG: energy transducer TonB [Bryobacteraceae bacterium]|jgi:protein TonB